MDQGRRVQITRALRALSGGVTQFSNGKSKLYFRAGIRPLLTSKLHEMFGPPLEDKPMQLVWWSNELTAHIKMVSFKHDIIVIIPSVGGEVKGAYT